ncbi:MAG TPA: response regulator transcription factor [Terriglobia bacterium]|nr:response regulator transcription factor [Terriglobia bacterium]
MKLGIISPRVLIRRALSTFLASTGAALVVMEGNNIYDSVEEVRRSHPEMLIIDLCGQRLEALPDLEHLGVNSRVVVLMDDQESITAARAFQLGIWGCLSTSQSPMIFQKALDSVARGERWLPRQPAIRNHVEKREHIPRVPDELTPREWEVLGLVANGLRNKEISARLNISEETAKSHVKSIYRKLRIKGRRDAMLRYFEFVHRPAEREHAKVVKISARSSQ